MPWNDDDLMDDDEEVTGGALGGPDEIDQDSPMGRFMTPYRKAPFGTSPRANQSQVLRRHLKSVLQAHQDRDPTALTEGVKAILENEKTLLGMPTIDDIERIGKAKIQKAAPGIGKAIGYGLAGGTMEIGQSGGTLLKWLGERVNNAQLEVMGEDIEDSFEPRVKRWELPEFHGNVIDNPDLLGRGAWWAYNVSKMIPSLAVTLAPGGLIRAGVGAPAHIVKLAKMARMTAIGITGGSLEAAQTYNTVLKETGDHDTANAAGVMMGLGSGFLNALSGGKILETAAPGVLNAVKKAGLNYLWEGATEAAEEPVEALSTVVSKMITGKDLVPEEIQTLVLNSLKQAATVFPVAGVTGAGASAVSDVGFQASKRGRALNQLTAMLDGDQTSLDELKAAYDAKALNEDDLHYLAKGSKRYGTEIEDIVNQAVIDRIVETGELPPMEAPAEPEGGEGGGGEGQGGMVRGEREEEAGRETVEAGGTVPEREGGSEEIAPVGGSQKEEGQEIEQETTEQIPGATPPGVAEQAGPELPLPVPAAPIPTPGSGGELLESIEGVPQEGVRPSLEVEATPTPSIAPTPFERLRGRLTGEKGRVVEETPELTAEEAKVEFGKAWDKAYGVRPETEPIVTALSERKKLPIEKEPTLTRDEAQQFAKMTDKELAEYNASKAKPPAPPAEVVKKKRGMGVSVEDAYKSGMDVKTIAKTFSLDYTDVTTRLEKAGFISVNQSPAPVPKGKEAPVITETPGSRGAAVPVEKKWKEAWEMTLDEYEAEYGKPRKNTTVTGGFSPHKEAVTVAVRQGKPVPPQVLADYPDLVPKPEVGGEKKAQEPFNGYNRLIDIENNLGIFSNRSIPDSVKRDATRLIEAIKNGDGDTISKIERKYQKETTKGDVQGGPREVKGGDVVKSTIANVARLNRKPTPPPTEKVKTATTGKQEGLFGDTTKKGETRDLEDQGPVKPPIEDFGEKIGGARKDTAERGFTKSKGVEQESTEPPWKKRFKALEKVDGSGLWVIADVKADAFVRNSQTFSSQEEAEKAIPLYAVAQKHSAYQNEDKTFSIYKKVTDRKRLKVVNQDFPTREDAMTYMATHAEEILNIKTSFGEEILPTPEKAYRKGVERRTGPATPEMFMETFAPRGIEFGNWNNQDERQEVMNHAYDGLLDLAEVMNVPPKALMLNGDLAIAFGARGQGLSGAKAHYEPGYGVINLTKMKGAGSLAHEWFHALDHYFARLDTKAKSEKVKNKRGDMVYPVSSPKYDMITHGESYKTKLRPEIVKAYREIVETIYKKAEQYVEDTQRADQFVATARKNLKDKLDEIRRDIEKEYQYKQYRKNKVGIRAATAEELAEWDKLSSIFVEGGSLETKYMPGEKKGGFGGRITNDALETLNKILKAVRNRSGFNSQQNGRLDYVRSAMQMYAQRLQMFKDAQAGTEKTKKVPTNYAIEARKMDQARAGDYWSEQHEMAARAFSSYVEDKIAEQGGQSDFLVYQAHGGIILPMIDGFVARPYPEGKEREAINRAFDNFVQTLETQETEKGVTLLSKKVGRYPSLQNRPETVAAIMAPTFQRIFRELNIPEELTRNIKVKLVDSIPGNLERSNKMWERMGERGEAVAGIQFPTPFEAVIYLTHSYAAGLPADLDAAIYHEAYHAMRRWLMPKADQSAVKAFFDGNEEAEAEAWVEYLKKTKAERFRAVMPGAVRKLWNRIIRFMESLGNWMKKGKFTTPDAVFERLLGAEKNRAGMEFGGAVPGEVRALRDGEGTSFSVEEGEETPKAEGGGNYWYEQGEVPEGSWVHGRAESQNLRDDVIVLGTKNWDVADQYAGKKGSKWFLTANDRTKVIDADRIIDDVFGKLNKQWKDGNLFDEELRSFLENIEEGLGNTNFTEEFNPSKIVESAGIWDSPRFVEWFAEHFDDIDGVITQDGIAIVRPDNFTKSKVSPSPSRPPSEGGTRLSTKDTPESKYKKAGDTVDGRTVRKGFVPNTDSIGAELDDYEVLPGIREVPMSDFELSGKTYSVEGNKRIAKLADQIKESKEITPLIVVVDNEGAYILEGATRADALKRLNAKSFPALVVVDRGDTPETMARRQPKPGAAAGVKDILPPEVWTRYQEAAKGIQRDALPKRIASYAKEALISMTPGRQFRLLPNKYFGKAAEIMRHMHEIPSFSKAQAVTDLEKILDPKNLKPNQYDLFTLRLVLEDLQYDITTPDRPLYRWQDRHEELPFGFTSDEQVAETLEAVRAKSDADQAVRGALDRRQQYLENLRRDLVNKKLLPPEVLDQPHYFHHQVLEYANARYGFGLSHKDARVHKAGWQIHRVGSIKDYSTEYLQAEFEIIAQGIERLETAKDLQEVKAGYDIRRDLVGQAKRKNLLAIYGGQETFDRVQALRGAIRESQDSPDARESDERARRRALIEELTAIDPLYPYRTKIAIAMSKLADVRPDIVDGDVEGDIYVDEDSGGDLFERIGKLTRDENQEGHGQALGVMKAVQAQKAFIKETLGDSFATWESLVRGAKPIEGSKAYVVWKPKPGSVFYMTSSINERVLDAIFAGDRELTRDDVRQVWARAKGEQWVIPQELAETMDRFRPFEDQPMISKLAEKTLNKWKQWILINPFRVIKYNVNNLSGDLDICLAYDPKILKYTKGAMKDLWRWQYKKGLTPEVEAEMKQALRDAVVGSGMTVRDIPDIIERREFRDMIQVLHGKKPHLIREYGWNKPRDFTTWRENVLRLAAYRYFKEKVHAGGANAPIFGASDPAKVLAVSDLDRRAALLARELIGDYGGLSEGGQWLRRYLVPFYSWCVPEYTEILTRRGWKRYHEIEIGEMALTYNLEKRKTEWQPVQDKAAYPFDGDLVTLKNSYGFRYQFTEDHRVVVIEKYKDKRKMVLAKDLKTHHHIPIVAPHEFSKESILTETEASLLGWLVTDGYFRVRDYAPNSFEAVLYQKKPEEVSMIRERFAQYISSESVHPDTGVICFRLKAGNLNRIRQVFKSKDDLPSIVTRLGHRECQAMYDAMLAAEGTSVNGFTAFPQNNGPVIDAFQVLCYMLGKAGHIRKKNCRGFDGKNTENQSSLYVKKNDKIQLYKWKNTREKYTGIVWCPKTENGTWVMRQDGKVMITGNCEINLPRYVRMWRNVPLEGQADRRTRTVAMAVKKGLSLFVKMHILFAAIGLWNRLMFPDEDDEIEEAGRRQLHLILGRRPDGSVISLRLQGALSDALAWFEFQDYPKDLRDLATGRKSFWDQAKELAFEPVNRAVQMGRPEIKTGAELLTGQSLFPDINRPMPIRDKAEHLSRLFSMDMVYKRIAGKPIRGDDVTERILNDVSSMVVYTADPGEASYHRIRKLAVDYLEKIGKEPPRVTPTDSSNALYYYRQALKYGDVDAAYRYLTKYKELGGKPGNIKASIKRAHPLAIVPNRYRRGFLASIHERDRKALGTALEWYSKTYGRGGMGMRKQ